jgi:hypothetical protein
MPQGVAERHVPGVSILVFVGLFARKVSISNRQGVRDYIVTVHGSWTPLAVVVVLEVPDPEWGWT